MTTKPAEKPATPYINNPFLVSIEGVDLFFKRANQISIFLIIVSVALMIYSFIPAPESANPFGQGMTPDMILWFIVPQVALTLLTLVVSGVLGYASAKLARGESVTLNQAISGFMNRFWGFVWLQILLTLKIVGWTLLLIVPGVIMAIRYSLADIAFFDKNLSANQATKYSAAITKGSWLTTFASQTLLTMLSFGIIAPLTSGGALAILYRQFDATPLEKRPKTHGLSIATLVGSILLVLLMLAAGVLLAVLATQALGA